MNFGTGGYNSTDYEAENGITWGRTNVYINNGGFQIKSGTSNCFWNKTEFPGAITEVVVYKKTNNSTLNIGTSVKPTSNSRTASNNGVNSFKFNKDNNYRYIKIAATNNSYCVVEYVTVVYSPDTDPTQTCTVTYSINGTTTQQILPITTDLQFPSVSPTMFGKHFFGWTKDEVFSSQKPECVNTIGLKAEADVTYTAVFATKSVKEGVEESWTKVSALDEIEDGCDYIITYDGKYYLPNNTYATSNPKVGKGNFDVENTLNIEISDDMTWTFNGDNTNGFSICHFIADDKFYLNSTDKAQGISVDNSQKSDLWKFVLDDNSNILMHGAGTTRYLQVYSNQDWRYYVEKNNIVLFKKKGGALITYDDFTTTPGKYTRSISSTNYSTICLPCSVAEIPENANFYSVAGYRGEQANPTSIVLVPVNSLDAGTPYIFNTSDNAIELLYSEDNAQAAQAVNGLVGSFVKAPVASGDYIYGIKNNELVKVGNNVTVGANRAYIDMSQMSAYDPSSTVKGMVVLGVDGVVDGIGIINTEGNKVVYDLQGRKVINPANGLYIINGKKVMVK